MMEKIVNYLDLVRDYPEKFHLCMPQSENISFQLVTEDIDDENFRVTSIDRFGNEIKQYPQNMNVHFCTSDLLCIYKAKRIYESTEKVHWITDAKDYGVIDLHGNEIIPQVYDYLMYDKGLFLVKKDGLYGVLSEWNTWVIPAEYSNSIFIYDDFIKVGDALFDKRGRCIVKHVEGEPSKCGNLILLKRQNGDYDELYDYSGDCVCAASSIDDCPELPFIRYEDAGDYVLDYDEDGEETMVYVSGTGVDYLSKNGKSLSIKTKDFEIEEIKDRYIKIKKVIFIDDSIITYYGVLNSIGAPLLRCVYRSLTINDDGSYTTDRGEINSKLELQFPIEDNILSLPAKYINAKRMGNTIRVYDQTTEKYGLLDLELNELLPSHYKKIYIPNNGHFILTQERDDKAYSTYSLDGELIKKERYTAFGKIENGKAIVYVEKKEHKEERLAGFVDDYGREILPPICSFLGKKSLDRRVFMTDGIWGWIDLQTDSLVYKRNYAFIGMFHDDGTATINKGGIVYRDKNALKVKDGKWGAIDMNGTEIIPCMYDSKVYFKEELACVSIDSKYGFIDVANNIVIPFEWEEAVSFNDGYAGVRIGDKWGMINRKGELVVDALYEKGIHYLGEYGYFAISDKTGKQWGVVSVDFETKETEMIVPIAYDDIQAYDEMDIHGFVCTSLERDDNSEYNIYKYYDLFGKDITEEVEDHNLGRGLYDDIYPSDYNLWD